VKVTEIMLYRFASATFGWVREPLLVVAVVFTVRLLVTLRDRRRK